MSRLCLISVVKHANNETERDVTDLQLIAALFALACQAVIRHGHLFTANL